MDSEIPNVYNFLQAAAKVLFKHQKVVELEEVTLGNDRLWTRWEGRPKMTSLES